MSDCCHTEVVKQESPTVEGVERTKAKTVYQPRVDIVDGPEGITLHVSMPGVDEQHVDVSLEKNVLTIRGFVDPPQHDGFRHVYSEYGIGDYERSFQVTNEIDREKISATVKNGVLTLQLPKVKSALQTRIPVTAG